MPRRELLFQQYHYYHLYNRSESGEPVFLESDNYLFFLKRLKKVLPPDLTIVAYCLMPTHYHFCVRPTDEADIAKFISRLLNSYVKAFNKRYKRSGRMFADRFKPVHVDKDEYLLHLCRYIHLNPVKAGLVQKPHYWAFSNFLEFVDKRNGTLVDKEFRNEFWGDAQAYEAFVMDFQQEQPRGFENILFDE